MIAQALLPGTQTHRLSIGGLHCVLYRADETHVPDTATPLLLVHSVNAAASAFEMEPLLMQLARSRPVLALDLPGFGASDRTDLAYTPLRMRDAVLAAAQWITAHVSSRPIDVIALSLSCEFATQAVLQRPASFRSLALISPTGMERRRADERYDDGRTRVSSGLRWVLRSTPVGSVLYRLLTTRASMRWFLSRTWGRSDFDPRLLEQGQRCARQPGAEHAPLDFVSGALFTRGIIERYRAVPVPLWVAHGTRGSFTDFGACPEFTGTGARRRQVHTTVFETGAMPHFEQPQAFIEAYEHFLQQHFGDGVATESPVAEPDRSTVLRAVA